MQVEVKETKIVGNVTITLTPEEAGLIKRNTELETCEDCFRIHSRTAADLLKKIVELDI